MEEIWKNVVDYEGLYEVSNLGQVRSMPRKGTFRDKHILRQAKNNNGYPMVHLFKNGKGKAIAVHRIVAKTFLKNPLNKRDVNHIDGNKENNNISNLEWTTHTENMKHARKHNLIAISNNVINQGKKIGKKYGKKNGKKRAKKVIQYKDNNILNVWNSLTEANKNTNVAISEISRCCNNKKAYAGGYQWSFLELNKELISDYQSQN